MKAQLVRDMSDDALFEKAAQLRESIFRLRFKLSLGNQDTVKQMRVDRKDLARVKTELRTRELTHASEAGGSPRPRAASRAERRIKTARALRGQKR